MKGRLSHILALISNVALMGCATLSGLPPAKTTEQRIAAFPVAGLPVQRPVTIHWSREQIPFIEAQTDRDAAFALGLVHAHLRLGQLEMLRRVSQGRLTEIAGPLPRVRQTEQALRILDLGKTSDEVYARMDAHPKAFLDAFVEGLNYYQANAEELPHEYRMLGIAPEPWRPQELLTLGRLASVDVSWFSWFRLMRLRDRPDWPQLWAEALERGTASAPSASFAKHTALQDFSDLLAGTARTGSNSFAVGGARTQSGSAIIASDPHLGVNLPNIWLLAGFKSPSYHAAGFMIPGLPFVAVGRNPSIAWGGTNLRSAASDLIDVSSVPADQIVTRDVPVRVRWWFDGTLRVRDTPYGPMISDADLIPKRPGEQFALKWIGHRPSDEFSSMLHVNRADNWEEFRAGLEGFAISAQNFIYADTSGKVGQVTTTHLPLRAAGFPPDIVRPVSDAAAWERILTSRDLPSVYDPVDGFVASANNKPTDTPYPIGYFFSGDDRVLRMREVLSDARNVTVNDVKQLQTDTYMVSAARLRDALVSRAGAIAELTPEARSARDAIAAWDARFDAGSRGAVAYQAAVATLVPNLFDGVQQMIVETGGSEGVAYAERIERAAPGTIEPFIVAALNEAARVLALFPTWGDMHTLELRHSFGMIPVVGGRFRFGELPWPGSTETLWRADHDLNAGKMTMDFGAQARHISDMSDLDSNWFALLGGNDGWFNSANFLDQVDVFQKGELVQVPLRLETVRARFPYRTELAPR